MQTVSPNLAKQMRASCTLAVASGENAKLRADIANVFFSWDDSDLDGKRKWFRYRLPRADAFGGRRDPTRLMTCLPVSAPTKQIPS
jgi:hypothetical protein